MNRVRMDECNDIQVALCPTWNGTTFLAEHVSAQDYREVVGFWQEAIAGWTRVQGENELLRKRIDILEAQVAQWGM